MAVVDEGYEEVAPGVGRFRDSCNVYVLRSGRDAVLIDVGTGALFGRLEALGIDRVTDVLVTHHHRDNVQGLPRAVEAGARIWVPPVEQELIAGVDRHWRRHRPQNDYDTRQHRFSLVAPVAIAGTVDEYRTRAYGAVELYTLPVPGHTIGSVAYLLETGGRRLAFTGDLLYAPGKLWSLAATQWSYGGTEGQHATTLSLGVLARERPDLLLPSHGEPMPDAVAALEQTRVALGPVMEMRRSGEPRDTDRWLDDPLEPLTPHLLRNRTSIASSFALLSDSGAALIVDWGYDLWPGLPLGMDRAGSRPLLQSIGALRRNHGVDRVEAVVATHFHDDHVAGMNLLREVEGTEVWAPANVVPVMEHPERYDLPCLWFDPIPVDRPLALGEPVAWHEYELTAHALPGHTLYAGALQFEVDGTRVLATGDQQGGGAGDVPDVLNYQYRNRFAIDDYVASAELYARLRPELLITGHWAPRRVDGRYLEQLLVDGRALAALHRELLPEEIAGFGAEGFAARIVPYRSTVAAGATLRLDVEVRSPTAGAGTARVELALPDGWECSPQTAEVDGDGTVSFDVRAGSPGLAVIAADVTVGAARFGQQAEALVDVT